MRLAASIFKNKSKKWDPRVDRPIEIDEPDPVAENENDINEEEPKPVAEIVNVKHEADADTDDDFENPPPKIQKENTHNKKRKKRTKSVVLVQKKKEEKDSKRKKQEKNQKDTTQRTKTTFEGIVSRQSPSKMVTLFLTMDEKSKKVVKSMGFGSMVSCKVDAIPSKLAYWIVDNFDASACEMQFGKEKVKITKEDVERILGFTMGNISVSSVERVGVGENNVIIDWRKQYPVPTKGT